MATIFGSDSGDELSCDSPPWLGDVDEDGAVDVLFACRRNIYGQWSGASLSVPGSASRRLLLQRHAGGVP